MSTLQFVIILVTILIATNRPTHPFSYMRKIRTWLFKHRVAKVSATLRRHGVLFRRNSANDVSALCLSEDFFSQSADSTGMKKIAPTFTFATNLRETREVYEDRSREIIADFLFELCNKQYPRRWFSRKLLGALKTLVETERKLFVPQVPTSPEQTLILMKVRLDKYIQDNR